MKHDLIIVGAGAAGIMAAITAKDYGLDVALIEGNDRIGKKILTTGNGRCNITNKCIDDLISAPTGLIRYHSSNDNFFLPVLKAFKVQDTISFFQLLGLPLVTLEDGKMYPMSLQASSALDVLRMAVSERDIPVYLERKVHSIKHDKSSFQIAAKGTDGEELFTCSKLIICTGGKAAPNTGSDGSGFSLCQKLGHTIIKPLPALVQLKLDYKNLKALSGIKFDGSAEILVDSKSLRKESGEILFTDYGISGPPILQLSGIASQYLDRNKTVDIKVNLLPNMDLDELNNFIEERIALLGHRSILDSFIGVIHKKMIPIILKEAGIDNIHKPLWELDWKEKKALINLFHQWKFKVSGTQSYSNAQVTSGGIDTAEVDSSTLQSKLHKNLYFAGEILDVYGDCGGYNLQWAWSSGYIAARSCKE